ncbi:site-2 protease family protein [uncultured Methanobrevibacter sp.]|uniref:site-2 protease family protein n=1 Tax=uncultured Methanobrevibacter sp. TaxID=253161 RepID=UPI0025FE298A|nr:site-2 protease family protein [uncultured Methanobrevibacter sp.]
MFKISKKELKDIFIAFLVISLSFSLLYSNRDTDAFLFVLPIVMIGVGLGFILHELAHKFAALNYGYWAEFELWMPGLFIALISSFFGFIFAAPGAVVIYGNSMSKKVNGIISIVGPITNIVIALIFLLGLRHFGIFTSLSNDMLVYLANIFYLGFSVNAFLALFNLLPIAVFDGKKVFDWNPIIWLAITAIAGYLVYLSYSGGLSSLLTL